MHYPTFPPRTCSAPWMCGSQSPGRVRDPRGPSRTCQWRSARNSTDSSRQLCTGLGNMGRVTPETFIPRSSRDQPIRTDSSLMPEQGTGPGSPLKVLDHGGIWGSQVRGQGNWGSGEPSGGTGTAALYQLVGTCFDVLTTWTAVLAANEPCLVQQD